jgi:hypothetical protein
MNTVLTMRVRAAGAEMSKPGRWRVALEQLEQAVDQLLGSSEFDAETARLALDALYGIYQWTPVMQEHERRRLNATVFALSDRLTRG